MYVRLGFSVAINVDPEILVVDEVLAVGDAEFQLKCEAKFKEYKSSGKTIILVSHSLTSVSDMCDQVAWLDHGKLVQVGETKKVIAAYKKSITN